MDTSRAVINLWYVTADSPAAVLAAEPRADRGYGRKYLAQLNPAFPVTPIGQFPVNRSAPADEAEFYIGGYPGVTLVQTVIVNEDLRLSALPQALLQAAPAKNIYAFISDEKTSYAGFGHWADGMLKRSFCATRIEIVEDIGLPEPFEGPYWAGEHNDDEEGGIGIALPFAPRGIMAAAQNTWLGITIGEDGPDLDVVGYAVDGRPEPKVDKPSRSASVAELASTSAAKLGIGPGNDDYDDYEDHLDSPEPAAGDEFARFTEASANLARKLGREALNATTQGVAKLKSLSDRWRS